MKEEPSPPPPPTPPTLPPPDLLTTTMHHLSTLQSHLPNIHHFKTQWSLISTKLTTLSTLLSSFPPTIPPSPLLSPLLSSLSSTLHSSLPLARLSSSPSPPPLGKLHSLNLLHSLSSTLHRHLHDLPILLSSPTTSTSTSTTTSLLTKLQIGSLDSKHAALDSLLDLLNHDDKNVLIAVSHGAIPILIKSLDTTSWEMKEKIVAAIARVSTVESSRQALLAEGLMLLNNLIRVIECGTGFAKERACVVLRELSVYKDNARAIGSRGGISSLLEICHAGTPSSQAVAAGVLRNLAMVEEVKENFVEECAVGVLIALAGSGTQAARENAVGCLANLVCGDDTLKVLVAREGGVECLRNYWDSVSTVGKELEPAVELLRNLAGYTLIREVLVTEGFQCRLLPLLNCGVLAVRIAAAGAVYELGFCSRARREMGECGCVTALVRMLDGKAVEEKEAAAKALSSLLLCHMNRKVFRKEERGVAGTVQLLDPLSNKNLDKKWPVAVLAALVQSKKCRKHMVAAGACVYLQKLADLDVDGAKKLLESLGKGKLWGVFARP